VAEATTEVEAEAAPREAEAAEEEVNNAMNELYSK
jgi:hypothetical protein